MRISSRNVLSYERINELRQFAVCKRSDVKPGTYAYIYANNYNYEVFDTIGVLDKYPHAYDQVNLGPALVVVDSYDFSPYAVSHGEIKRYHFLSDAGVEKSGGYLGVNFIVPVDKFNEVMENNRIPAENIVFVSSHTDVNGVNHTTVFFKNDTTLCSCILN